MKTAVIYCRKSTEDQSKHSIEGQERALREFCLKRKISVLKVYVDDGWSAKTFERPNWRLLYRELKALRPDYLLVHMWDRLSRNSTEAVAAVDELKQWGVEANAISNWVDYEADTWPLLLGFYLSLPHVDNLKRSMHTKKGIHAGLMKGCFVYQPPIGYKRAWVDAGPTVVADGEKSVWVRRSFELMLALRNQTKVRFALRDEVGYLIPRQSMSRLLKNQAYIGKVYLLQGKGKGPLWMDGLHDGIVKEDLFWQVQGVMDKRSRTRGLGKVVSASADFPLKGVLLCNGCNKPMTASKSRGKQGKRYGYYHCQQNGCGERHGVAKVHDLIRKELYGLELEQDMVDLFAERLAVHMEVLRPAADKERLAVKRVAELEGKLDRLQDLLLAEDGLSLGDYKLMRGKLEVELLEYRGVLAGAKDWDKRVDGLLKEAVANLHRLGYLWDAGDYVVRNKLVSSIFPDKVYIVGEGVRTPAINELVRVLGDSERFVPLWVEDGIVNRTSHFIEDVKLLAQLKLVA